MPKAKRKELTGRGAVGKTAVAGVKDRATNHVMAQVVLSTDAPTLQGFVRDYAGKDAVTHTDGHGAYTGLDGDFAHEAVNHGAGEYVRGMAHTQGIESLRSMLKRAHKGTFHRFSPKHPDRYVQEFSRRHNVRDRDTIDIIATFAAGAVGKWLRYRDLIADNGMPSGSRA